MVVSSFLKSSGFAALAAGLALIALPAAAQDRPDGRQGRSHGDWGGNRGGGEGGGNSGGGWQGRAQAAPQSAPQAAQHSAPQAEMRQQAQQEQRSWTGRPSGGDNNGSWGGARRVQREIPQAQTGGDSGSRWSRQNGSDAARTEQRAANPSPPVQRSEAPRNEARSGWNSGSQGRNGTYVDPSRNRDTNAANNQRDNDRGRNNSSTSWSQRNRDNSRGNEGWQGNNRGYDNNRWQGHGNSWSNNNHRDNDRSSYSGNYRQWNNDWRRDNRYNWQGYRNQNRSIFRLGSYYSPYRNYSYSSIGIGFYLDSLFYSNRYWINDPWQYRLPEAYGPYRWVRYYDDALLVDVYSGEVVDVIRDFFW